MTAEISPTEVGYLRAGNHTVKRYLSLPSLTSVATARLNQAVFTSPLAQLTVDGTSADWLTAPKVGMSVLIGTSAGASDMGVYRLRKATGATTLYINEVSVGDSGLLATSTLTPFADNAYITIVKDYAIWSVFPKIVYSGAVDVRTGVFFKDFEVAYTDQNSATPPPVLNIGDHRVADLTLTGATEVEFTFTANSVQWVGNVDTYAWDIDGGTVTSGDIDEITLDVEFEEGHYVVSCTITLDTGATQTARRHVFVHGSTYRPLEIQLPRSDRRDIAGRKMVLPTLDEVDNLISGCLGLYWEVASWNGNTVTEATTTFAGFLTRLGGSVKNALLEGEIELVSALELCKEVQAFSQQLTASDAPTTWQECNGDLAYLDFWLFYILHYHTSLLVLFDYNVLNLATYHQAWSVEPSNFYEQLQSSCKRVAAQLGQTSSGALFVRKEYNLLDGADRTRDERMEISVLDVIDMQWTRRNRPRVGKVNASGFSYDFGSHTLTPLLAVAQGFVGGQGAGVDSLENQLVDDQTELNIRAANQLARANSPYEDITFTMGGNYDVFEPARGDIITTSFSSSSVWQGGFALTCILKTVTVRHEGDGQKVVSITVEAETAGHNAPAQTVTVHLPSSGNGPYLTDNPYVGIDFVPINPTTGLLDFTYDPFQGLPFGTFKPPNHYDPVEEGTPLAGWVLAWFEALEYTDSGYNDEPDWTPTFDERPTELVASVIHSSASPFLSNVTDALWAWCLTDAGLYYNDDVFGAGTWDLQEALVDYTLLRHAAGVSGGLGIVAFRQALDGTTSIKVAYSEDGGPTITETEIDVDEMGDTGGDVDDFDLGVILVAADNKLFLSDDANSTYNEVTGLTGLDGSAEISVVRIPYRKLLTQVLNDDVTALQFIYGTRSLVSGKSLWAVTLNANTLVIANQTDITPIVNGVTFTTDGAESLETFGGDTRIISAWCLGTPPSVWFNHFDGDDSQGTFGMVAGRGDLDAAQSIVYKENAISAILEFDYMFFIDSPTDVTAANVRVQVYALEDPSASTTYDVRLKVFDGGSELYSNEQNLSSVVGWQLVEWSTGTLTDAVKVQIRVVGPSGLATWRIEVDYATVYGTGTSDTHSLIRSEDGGETWELQNSTFDGTFVRFIGPDQGGDGSRLWVAGPDGIGYSSDKGLTIEDKLGDFDDTEGRGAYGFG